MAADETADVTTEDVPEDRIAAVLAANGLTGASELEIQAAMEAEEAAIIAAFPLYAFMKESASESEMNAAYVAAGLDPENPPATTAELEAAVFAAFEAAGVPMEETASGSESVNAAVFTAALDAAGIEADTSLLLSLYNL